MFQSVLFILLLIPSSPQQTNIEKLILEKSSPKRSIKDAKTLARYFIKYGKKWNVNSLLAASVAWKESTFKKKPRPWKKCKYHSFTYKKRYKKETCKIRSKGLYCCRPVRLEEGMMQVIPWEKTTRDGFKLCTGKDKRPTRKELRDPETNICIGIYEMSEKRREVSRYISYYRKHNILSKCKWYNKRLWSYRHRKFFRKHPHLQKYFWVAAYNWGCCRVFTHNKSIYDTVGYPLRVLRIFNKYNGKPSFSPPAGKKISTKGKLIVRFESGENKISNKYMNELKDIAAVIKKNNLKVKVLGYTDYLGSYNKNIKLSKLRAKRVYNILIDLGVNPDNVSYKGMGETNPIATNRTLEGRAKNRRVEITWSGSS